MYDTLLVCFCVTKVYEATWGLLVISELLVMMVQVEWLGDIEATILIQILFMK